MHAFLLSHEAKHVCEVEQFRDGRFFSSICRDDGV